MRKSLVFGAAAAALVAGTDFTPPADAAEDVPAVRRAAPARIARPAPRPAAQPAQAPASNWTGSQAGGQGGGANGSQSFADPPFICVVGFSCPVSPFAFSGSPTSATGGAFLGYRWQFGWMVFGAEADISAKKLETTVSQRTDTFVTPFIRRYESFTGSIKQGWDASFRLRAGYLVTPWTLAYITGGLAVGEVSGSFNYSGELVSCCRDGIASVNSSWNDTRVGGTVGAGLEHALGPFLKARVEYRYTDFGKYSKTVPVFSSSCTVACVVPASSNVELHAAFHKVTVGLGFDF